MVKMGHVASSKVAISELGYRNPVAPGLSVEAFTLAELRERVSAEHTRRSWRLEFHQIILITSGHGRQNVDFVNYPCEPGTLLWTWPGQVERRQFGQDMDGHIAAMLGYSTKTVNRACRAAAGSGAKEIIDRRVILEARRLLAHSDLPAAAIAQHLGFAQATNFGKYFIHHVGATPGEFRLNGTG